jgi:type III secretion system FlhB-like substrate exporter
MIMAGLIDTPQERIAKRLIRRQQRAQIELQRDMQLVDMIGRREKGGDGMKPMPFARPKE